MTATDAQVRLIMKERRSGKTQEQAAVRANLRSRKTVRKYEKQGKLPSELKQPRSYRTREDAFTEDWGEVEKMLEEAPGLEGKAVFEWLQEQKPGKYQEGQLRTFQRRVSNWRALKGRQVLSLEQVHHPGEVLQTDGTWMNELKISIQGEAFEHLLIHSVLPYSNWEYPKGMYGGALPSRSRYCRSGWDCKARWSSWGMCLKSTRQTTARQPRTSWVRQRAPKVCKSAVSTRNICNCWRTMACKRVARMSTAQMRMGMLSHRMAA